MEWGYARPQMDDQEREQPPAAVHSCGVVAGHTCRG